MAIEVFVRSFSTPVDVERSREAISHYYCSPATASATLRELSSKFRGRLLPSDEQQAIALLGDLSERFHDSIKLYDVSGSLDKIRAMKRGVRKTPAVVINGRKYEGMGSISALLSSTRTPA